MLAAATPPEPTAPNPAPAPAPKVLVPLVPAEAPSVAPSPSTELGQQPPREPLVRISETRYRMGKIEIDQITHAITFEAAINMDKGMLEYALVTNMGKVHEALLSTEISPFNLNLSLLLLHYKPAENFIPAVILPYDKQPKPGAKPSPIDGTNSFGVKISWKDLDDKAHSAYLEEWIFNDATKATAIRKPFAYTGSQLDHHGRFIAQMDPLLLSSRIRLR